MFDAIWDGFRPLLPVLVMVAFIGILVVIVLAYIKRTPKAAGQDFSSYTPATFLLSKAGIFLLSNSMSNRRRKILCLSEGSVS
jgi:hypothetical protein